MKIILMLLGLSFSVRSSLGSTNANQLNIGWDNMPRTLDPRYAVDANAQYLEDLIHCSLFTYDADGNLTADAAETWGWRGPTTFEVSLKKEARFRSGEALSPEDVKETYRSFLRDDITPPPSRRGAFRNLEKITSEGHKILFHLKQADATFPQNLVIGLLPAKTALQTTAIADASSIDTCGFFYLSQKNTQDLLLKKNPNYSLSSPALSEEIRIESIRDEMTRFAKLRTGELHIVQNAISRDKLPKMTATFPNLKIARRQGLSTSYLGFNMQDPQLSKLPVRLAIAHAINRQDIIHYVLRDFASPATTLLTPASPFYKADLQAPSYDPELAKKILDEEGLRIGEHGFRFNLSLKTTTDMTRLIIAKAIANDLQNIGIKVKIESLEWSRFKADVDQGNVQLWTLAWIGFKDPDIYRYAFGQESFPPSGGNRGRFSDSRLDQLLSQALQSPKLEERRPLYDEVQERIRQSMPYVFLWHEDRFAVMQKNVEGFIPFADGRYRSLKDTYLKTN